MGAEATRAAEVLAEVSAEVSVCRRCPRLVTWREEVARVKRRAYADEEYWGAGVPGFGDPTAALVVLGLAPAAHGANRTGRMFTGDRSGDFLYAALHRAGLANQPLSVSADDGLALERVWITAPVRCAPPQNRPTTAERDTCAPYLRAELEVLRPRAILCLGRFAWEGALRFLGRPSPAPAFGHGAIAVVGGADLGGTDLGRTAPQREDGRSVPHAGQIAQLGRASGLTLVGSYHVSQQNTFTGRLTEAMFDEVLATAIAVAYP